jgi:hypothetical protein
MSCLTCWAGRRTTSLGRRCCCAGCWMGLPVRSRRGGQICRGGRRRQRLLVVWDRRPAGGCFWRERSGCVVRGEGEFPAKTEVLVAGQLALAVVEETVVPAAVWETLPVERQREVAVRLARLLARIVEAARDE